MEMLTHLSPAADKVARYEADAFIDAMLVGLGFPSCLPRPLPPTFNTQIPVAQRVTSLSGKVVGIDPQFDVVVGDDHRTAALTSLAGHLIAGRHHINDVITTALDWNSRNTPPLGENKVRDTCMSLLRTHLRNHALVPAREGDVEPLFDLASADISTMLSTAAPPQRWLLKDFLPLGRVGAIIAPGGTGKSQFVLQLGVSVASGIKFAGNWDVGEAGSVLLLFAEDDRDEIHRRLERTVAFYKKFYPDIPDQLPKKLWIKPLVSQNNLMTERSTTGRVEQTDFVERLILTVASIEDLKLIVIDPISRFRGGDENAAEDSTRFIEAAEKLREATGATVLLVHHAHKGALNAEEQDQNASRGSSAFSDGVRWQLNLSLPRKSGEPRFGISADARRRYLIATHTKNNYGKMHDDIALYRNEEGVLGGSNLGPSPNPLKLLVSLLQSEALAGHRYSASAFRKKFAGARGKFGMGDNTLRDTIKNAIQKGYVIQDKGTGKTLSPGLVSVP